MKKQVLSTFIIILIICGFLGVTFKYLKNKQEEPSKPSAPIVEQLSNFDYKIINNINTLNENTLVSPLSIGFALGMLNEGASNNTKIEIEELLDKYKLPKTIMLKDKLAIANSIFINELYKDGINSNYIKLLTDNYNASLNYDSFENSSNINKWIEDNTFGMIKNTLNEIEKQTPSILVNTVAVNMEWEAMFDCSNTKNETFTKYNDETINVEMMNSNLGNNYIESYDATGIVRYYRYYDKTTGIENIDNNNSTQFEFIAILPKKDINDYLNSFSREEYDRLMRSMETPSNTLEINVKLPKYTYDYELKDLNGFLANLGIKDAFNSEKADFSKMVSDQSLKMYVDSAIHKTHIEVNETGTKAAATTAIVLDAAMSVEEKRIRNVEFNKPFIYIIKEAESDNIFFIGTVFEPNHWNESSGICETEKSIIE